MNKELLMVTVIVLVSLVVVCWTEAESCSSCGSECQSACGTRHFRTCCFNYLKKRSSNPEPFSGSALDPSLKLELWLARSKYPYYQKSRPISAANVEDFLIDDQQNEIDNRNLSL